MDRENPESLYDMIALFGESCAKDTGKLAVYIFRKPLLFIWHSIKRLLRFIFRSAVLVFAPAGIDTETYLDEVTRGFKKCLSVLFSHPGSFFPVLGYYVKKAFRRYNYGFRSFVMWLLPACALAGLIVCVNLFADKSVALRIEADGETVGYVASEGDFIEARDSAAQVLSKSGADRTEVMPDITYSFTLCDINEFTDSNTIRNSLIKKSSADLTSACGLYIDGDFFAAVYNGADAENVLDGILADKKKDDDCYLVTFAEDIDFREGLYPASSVVTAEKLRQMLLYGDSKNPYYTCSEGDTIRAVAEKNDMTVGKLLEYNPILEGLKVDDELDEGSQIRIAASADILTLKEVKSTVRQEHVDFPVQEFQSEALYSGSKRVLSNGKKGIDQVTYLATYINGELTESTEFSRLNLQKPVAQRMQIGIKPLDEAYTQNTGGMLLWPVIGAHAINSPYGYRWGKIHQGIDIGMGNAPGTSLGKTIIAVASGTVEAAGRYPSYGNFVLINHGNGLQTAYGHCMDNSLLVVPGQQVVAGQPIAKVGQTGFATGPHLHFEVRQNGRRVDPAPYLGVKY